MDRSVLRVLLNLGPSHNLGAGYIWGPNRDFGGVCPPPNVEPPLAV